MTRARILRSIVTSAGLDGLWDRASRGARLPRADLQKVIDCGHPLAAAALADAARENASGVDVTHPWTVRVRAPGVPVTAEDATRVSHAVEALAGIPSTEAQIVGVLPSDLPLGLAIEMVRSVKVARPDLTLRALDSARIDALAARDGTTIEHVLTELRNAGLDTLDWTPGEGRDARAAAVHRAAHESGFETVAPIGYTKGEVGPALLDRLDAMRAVAEDTGRFTAAIAVPDQSEDASPLRGTSGTEDTLACAVIRLALGHAVKHITTDAHVVGHKLAAVLLTCGASDFVGAQAAARWAPPSGDAARPLNPDRVRRFVIEARRSPVTRDALFRRVEASTGTPGTLDS